MGIFSAQTPTTNQQIKVFFSGPIGQARQRTRLGSSALRKPCPADAVNGPANHHCVLLSGRNDHSELFVKTEACRESFRPASAAAAESLAARWAGGDDGVADTALRAVLRAGQVLDLDKAKDRQLWAQMHGLPPPSRHHPPAPVLGDPHAPRQPDQPPPFAKDLEREIRGVPEGERLCRAAWAGDTDKLCRLLWTGADANATGAARAPALVLAATAGNAEGMELLLGCGALTENVDADGRPALQLAARYGRARCIELLLRAGAEVDFVAEPDGCTALHLAAVAGGVEAVEQLMAAGANPRLRDKSGHTAGQLLLEQQAQQVARREKVLRILQEEPTIETGGTQTGMDLMPDLGELKNMVELSEFKGEIGTIKSDMLMLRRQMTAMVDSLGGATEAIHDLATNRRPASAQPIRLVPTPTAGTSTYYHQAEESSNTHPAEASSGRPWSADSSASTVFSYYSRPPSAASASGAAAHKGGWPSPDEGATPTRPQSAGGLAASPSALSLGLPRQYSHVRRPSSAAPSFSSTKLSRPMLPPRPQSGLPQSGLPPRPQSALGTTREDASEEALAREFGPADPSASGEEPGSYSALADELRALEGQLAAVESSSGILSPANNGKSDAGGNDTLTLGDRSVPAWDEPDDDETLDQVKGNLGYPPQDDFDWTKDEMARLHMAVGLRGDSTPAQWVQVASVVGGGRTAAECESAWAINQDRFTACGSWIGFAPSRASLGLPPEQHSEVEPPAGPGGRAGRDALVKKALQRDCNHRLRPADKVEKDHNTCVCTPLARECPPKALTRPAMPVCRWRSTPRTMANGTAMGAGPRIRQAGSFTAGSAGTSTSAYNACGNAACRPSR